MSRMRATWPRLLLVAALGATGASGCSSSGSTTVADAADAADALGDTSGGHADGALDGGGVDATDVGGEATPDVAIDVAPEVSPMLCGAASSCDPLSAAGCGGATPACDADKSLVACRAAGPASRGQTCDPAKGPACMAGLHCDTSGAAQPGACRQFCCQDADCSEPGTSCEKTTGLGALGLCTLHAGAYLPASCGLLHPINCDPFSNTGCDASTSVCVPAPGSSGPACATWSSTIAVGKPCGPAVSGTCAAGTMCAPAAHECRPVCCNDAQCTDGFTCIAVDTANLGSLGYCD
jgi:hypothetical protein